MMRVQRVRGIAAILIAAAAAAAPLAAQGKSESAGFLVRLGSDTLAAEQFVRTDRRLESEIAVRVPMARRVHYVAALDSSGRVQRFDITMRPLAGHGAPPMKGTVLFGADTADVTVTRGDSTQHFRVPVARGAVPMIALSHALMEQAIRQARRAGADSVGFAWLPLGNPEAQPSFVARRGKDSVDVGFFGDPMHVKTDGRGRLLGLDGRATTQKVVVTRAKNVNVGAWATVFAEAEAAHGPMGQLSPRDTVRARLGGANLMVDYGRPHKRGREVWGQLVPYGAVWRTGANAATQFTTDADLRIGNAAVPKGSYTLWTVPSAGGGELILNGQTGQWGTDYDASRDVVRVPLAKEALGAPVEQFTIALEPRGAGGVLRLSWDSTSYTVPVVPGSP
jgi:hypothetical protein